MNYRNNTTGRYDVGIVGATGLVGTMMLELLAERAFPLAIVCGCSPRLIGGRSPSRVPKSRSRTPAPADFSGLDFVFFSAGGSTSKALAEKVAAAARVVVIDNSSAWRADPAVPLVVAEVNPHALGDLPKGIVANPNCTTMAAMPAALSRCTRPRASKRLVASTYQAVSGGGIEGVERAARPDRRRRRRLRRASRAYGEARSNLGSPYRRVGRADRLQRRAPELRADGGRLYRGRAQAARRKPQDPRDSRSWRCRRPACAYPCSPAIRWRSNARVQRPISPEQAVERADHRRRHQVPGRRDDHPIAC